MGEAVIVAFISGILTLAGTVITVVATNQKNKKAYEISQAVITERVTQLTEEVRKHNGFAQRLPALEQRVSDIAERVKALENK